MAAYTVPNQKVVHVNRQKCDKNFLQISKENWYAAYKDLNATALCLYLYLAGNITNEQYDGTTFSATVPQANTKAVFGYEIAADVSVTVVNNGAEIISVHIEYNLPEEGEVKATHVVMDIEYTYDNERITLD